MKETSFRTTGVAEILIAVAGVFVALGAYPNQIALRLGISNRAFLIVGVGVFVCGLAVIIIKATSSGAASVWPWAKDRISRSSLSVFQARFAGRRDLPQLHLLYQSRFGVYAPRLEQMEEWHSRNSRIFRIIEDVEPVTGLRKIVGSYKLIPLTKFALAAFRLERITASDLREKDIVKPRGRPSGWYVGDVVSTSDRAAKALMKDLVEHFGHYLVNDREMPILARGLTRKGLHYLRSFQFKPVGSGEIEMGRLCALDYDQTRALVERLESPRRQPIRQKKTAKGIPTQASPDGAEPVTGS